MPEDLPENVIAMFTVMMQIGWLITLIATAEIVGGILSFIPKFGRLVQ